MPVGATGLLASLQSASANDQTLLSVLDPGTLERITTIPIGREYHRDMDASPDGELLAVLVNDRVRIWRRNDQKLLSTFEVQTEAIYHFGRLAFLPDNRRIAVGEASGSPSEPGNGNVRIADVMTGETLRVIKAHDLGITGLQASPKGPLIATGTGLSDPTIRLWNADTGKLVWELKGHLGWISDLAFSPDGSLLASASADQRLRLWDVTTGEPLATFRGHEDEIYSVAFSQDGKRLVSGGKDGSVRLWQVLPKPRFSSHLVIPAAGSDLKFSPDSRRFVTKGTGEEGLSIWNTAKGAKLETVPKSGSVDYFEFIPNTNTLVMSSGDHTLQLWNLDRRIKRELLLETDDGIPPITMIRMLINRQSLVTFHPNNKFRLWDMESRKPLGAPMKVPPIPVVGSSVAESSHVLAAGSLAVSGHGIIAKGFPNGYVRLWDPYPDNRSQAFVAHRRTVSGVAFSPDGTLLATTGEEGVAKLWDLRTLEPIVTLKGHMKSIHAIAISPDGRTLATGGSYLDKVILWDMETHHELMTLEGDGRLTHDLHFSPDGNTLVGIGLRDSNVYLWHAPSWETVREAEARRVSFERGQ